MLEFICLSKLPANVEKLAASIPLALGDLTPWKLTVVDGTRFDLFSGLNHGARQTQGEWLAFVHDDVQFLGNPLTMAPALQSLAQPQVGFVGIAGTRLLPEDGCWWGRNQRMDVLGECRGMIAHADYLSFRMHVNVWPPGAGQFGQVVVLDGVLLMCHRRTFDRLGGFDEENYKGFDFYDIDITFRATIEKLVNLALPIPLLHESGGVPGPGWEANRQTFIRKFGRMLPARIG